MQWKPYLSGALLATLAPFLMAGPADDLQQEELVLKNGTKLTVVQKDDRILAIIAGKTELFVSEEQQRLKEARKPYSIPDSEGHFPASLEKSPPLPDRVPEEIRDRLQAWRIVDDTGSVMDTIFCTEQGCSVGGYSYTTTP